MTNIPVDPARLLRRERRIVIARTIYKNVVALWVMIGIGLIAIWTAMSGSFFWPVWEITSPPAYFWPIWPILGMGVAAVIWGSILYGILPFRPTRREIKDVCRPLRSHRH